MPPIVSFKRKKPLKGILLWNTYRVVQDHFVSIQNTHQGHL